MRRAAILAAAIGIAAAVAAYDAVRITATAVFLGRMRKANPELFDGHAAALAVAICLAEHEAAR